MKYQVTGQKSITLYVRKGKSDKEVLKLVGSGTIPDKSAEAAIKTDAVKALVEEGQLRFPDNKEMEALYSKKEEEHRKRVERLSAVQEERKEKASDDSEVASEVAGLREELEASKKENEGMVKQLTDLSNKVDQLSKKGNS